MCGAVGVDRFELVDREFPDVPVDHVADLAHLVDRPARRVGDVPRIDGRRDVWARVTAPHRDRPVGVQLHLDRQLLWLAPADVEPGLAHHLDYLGPYLPSRIGARRLGANVPGA